MKKYADQGKVDTRSGFGAGLVPNYVKKYFSYVSVIIMLFFSVSSCCGLCEKEKPHPALSIKYCIDGHHYEFDVDRTPSIQGSLLKQLISQKYKFYRRPCFYLGQDADSLLTFFLTLPDAPLEMELTILSDTTAFFFDKNYRVSEALVYLEGYLLPMDEGVLKFTRPPCSYMDYVTEFELILRNDDITDHYLNDGLRLESNKHYLLSGSIEVLKGITDDRIGNSLK